MIVSPLPIIARLTLMKGVPSAPPTPISMPATLHEDGGRPRSGEHGDGDSVRATLARRVSGDRAYHRRAGLVARLLRRPHSTGGEARIAAYAGRLADGYHHILVGAYNNNDGGTYAGAAYLVLGTGI